MRKLIAILLSRDFSFYQKRLSGALILVLITIILNSSIPLAFKKSIELLSSDDNFQFYSCLIGYSLLWLSSQLISNIRTYTISILLEDLSAHLTLKLFNHLHSLSLRFHLERQTGSLAQALMSIQTALETLLWGSLLFLLPTILELIIAVCVIAILYGPLYAGIMCTIFLTFILISTFRSDWTEKFHGYYNKQRAAARTYYVESLSHAETVKYFSGASFENKQCKFLLTEQKGAAKTISTKTMLIQSLQSCAIGFGLVGTLIITAYGIRAQTLKVSDFVLIQNYILQFLMPLSHLGYFFAQFKKARSELTDALKFFDFTPEICDAKNSIILPKGPVSVTFDDVSFGYEENRSILNNCSFSALQGKKIAIVGATGAGKTTIVRLLFRLYEVTEGAIKINGIAIKEISQASLHALIGYVPQEILLFNNTLYYNITYGQPDKTQEEVEEAIHLAGLDSFIQALPEGFETIVGNNGLKISGGEKQRIALARVFLKKPMIYILDEATAALDSKTEKVILQKLRSITQNATTVIIAHRLSTVVDADEILVLDKGSIAQRGNHHDLLIQQGLYAQMWFMQHASSLMPTFKQNTREMSSQ